MDDAVKLISECIGDQSVASKKRIRSRIAYAYRIKKIKVKVTDNGRYLNAKKFFTWALEKWPELEKIHNLPLQKNRIEMNTVVSAQAAHLSLTTNDAVISKNYDELRQQFAGCMGKLQKYKIENERIIKELTEQREELIELRAYKEGIAETNRANARKAKGTPKRPK